MTGDAGCASPHPQRAHGSFAPHPDLERIGGCLDDEWFRCRRCGQWFWLTTDESSKWQYVDGWPLPRERAEKALLGPSLPDAIALFVDLGLPRGPIWTEPLALVELREALAPDATRDGLLQALREAALDTRWAGSDHALTLMQPGQGVAAVSPEGEGDRLVEPLGSERPMRLLTTTARA